MLQREVLLPRGGIGLGAAFPLASVTLLCFLAGMRLSEVRRTCRVERIERHLVTPPPPPPAPTCETYDVRTTITRATFDQWLADTDQIARSARIVPSLHRRDGLKLYAIRPDSPLAILGIRNGDILHRINGVDLVSPEHALEIYADIRSANRLTVDLTRSGCPVTLFIAIV